MAPKGLDVAPIPSAPCPLCGRPIMPGDSAGLHAGRILHLDCYIVVVHAGVAVLAYLKSRPREPFCTTCLVGAAGVTFDEMLLARASLSARRSVRVDVDRCAGCGGRRVTLLHELSADGERPTASRAAG